MARIHYMGEDGEETIEREEWHTNVEGMVVGHNKGPGDIDKVAIPIGRVIKIHG